MKSISLLRFSVLCFALSLLMLACKGPETTVVRQNPTPVSPDSIADDADATVASASFRQLNIGELNPIPTLDPLFAENSSTMRALQLVYEGLVRYNAEGDIMPGLASEWTISDDSLSYRFSLRDDIYYHDSNAFNNGLGRKLVARDVKAAFERMAKVNVPGHAAHLFMNIKGFEPYYREQHNIFNPKQRVLNGIEGITTPNDTTIVFKLAENNGQFLQKLASPYALIYPREAIVNNDPTQFKAVGAGPFILSQQRGDSLYIFAKFNDYYNNQEPVINRVDITVSQNEENLQRRLNNGDIHFIPEPGAQIMGTMLTENGELQSNYSSNFELGQAGGTTYYTLNFNRYSDLPEGKVLAAGSVIDSTYSLGRVPAGAVQFMNFSHQADSTTSLSMGDTLSITQTDDIFAKRFISMLSDDLQLKGVSLQVKDIRVPTRNTGLYIHSNIPFYSGQSWPFGLDHYTLAGFSSRQMPIYRNEIEKLSFNNYTWWMDLRSVTIPAIDNL